MELKQPTIVIVYGPTGVGKSALAEKLCSVLPAEIINMDIGQFYTPLSIGTAKPDWQRSSISQHLFDIIDTPKNITVCHYRMLVLEKINEVCSRGKLPILVGGSGFYLKSLLFPPVADAGSYAKIPALQEGDPVALWEKLYAIDPVRAQDIHHADVYRVRRALAIWYTTGQKPSAYVPLYNPPANFSIIYVERDRQELYDRIDRRVHQMIKGGLIDEVKPLVGTAWEAFLHEKGIIGYNEVLAYLSSAQTEDEKNAMVAAIQKRTRHYAKRQGTFWRMLQREIIHASLANADRQLFESKMQTVNLTLMNLDLYIKQQVAVLMDVFKER